MENISNKENKPEGQESISMAEAKERFPLQNFLDRGYISSEANVIVTESITKNKPPEDYRQVTQTDYPSSVFEIMDKHNCEEAVILDTNGNIIGDLATGFEGGGTTASYYNRYKNNPQNLPIEKTPDEQDGERVNAAYAVIWSWMDRDDGVGEIFVTPFAQS
jgi:hypothetical protein